MSLPTHPKELEQQGWLRRFTVEEHRAAEYVKEYESLGYEVLLLSARITEADKCDECFRADTCDLVTIYTRRKAGN